LLCALVAAQSITASAEEARGGLVGYSHQRWIEGSDVPAPILAMAQGRDDFIWLATGEGLFRFDGVRFEPIEAEGTDRKDGLPSALLVTKSGDVWTNFETSHRFAVYRNGALRILNAPPAPNRIIDFVEGLDGAIWALTANFDAEVLRFQDGHWRIFNAADGLPRSNSVNMLVAADGAIWIACTSGVARLQPGAERFEMYRDTPFATVSQDAVGRIWVSSPRGSYPMTGPGGSGSPVASQTPYRDDGEQIQSAQFDREGNLWIATRYDGIRRVAMQGASLENSKAEEDSFASHDGLTSDVANAVMEDREGNIWVGTEGGLDKFRRATLIAEPALEAPAVFGDKLLEASNGDVYVGQARTVYRVRPGSTPKPILNMVEPQSLCESPDGAIWIGLSKQIVVWANGSVRETIERPDKAANHSTIYDCAFDKSGDFWISAAGGGVHVYRHGRWETALEPGDRASFYPTTMVRTPQGGIVVQSGDRLVWIDGSEQTSTHLDFGAGGIKVLTLHSAGDYVYAAGSFGLSRFRGGNVETVRAEDDSPASRINGIVRTPQGDTWLAYPKAVIRLQPQELDQAFHDGVFSTPKLSLGFGDGLVSRPHSHSQRSMVRGGDGRLWIATETGTLWMDPTRIVRNTLPPNLAIKSVNADGHYYRDPTTLALPAATANIEIDFAALSFVDPGKVQARYILEGFDHDWVQSGARRQVFYTNLPAGKYTFRVTAANNDGVWNQTGLALELEIPPTFVQSIWFLLLCSGTAVALAWCLYRLRVAQIANRIRSRLEERIEERERIARELHDTLLQGVQGLILRFQAVADRIPPEQHSREQLEAALATADDVVVDARNRVHELRGTEIATDLCEIVEKLVPSVSFDPPIPVRIVVEGKPRALHPLVGAEVTRIVREALFNVARHAHASSVEIAIGFEARYLAVRVRDDGVGIPEHVLVHGRKEGHFGMIGMRERAEKIGGSITISSSPGSGAEVILSLPAELAFTKPKPHRRARSTASTRRRQ
jgi:signal transduction histidine kinase/ligand-binding sensor domain-containing protein